MELEIPIVERNKKTYPVCRSISTGQSCSLGYLMSLAEVIDENQIDKEITSDRIIKFVYKIGGKDTIICFDVVELYQLINTNPNAILSSPKGGECAFTEDQQNAIRRQAESILPPSKWQIPTKSSFWYEENEGLEKIITSLGVYQLDYRIGLTNTTLFRIYMGFDFDGLPPTDPISGSFSKMTIAIFTNDPVSAIECFLSLNEENKRRIALLFMILTIRSRRESILYYLMENSKIQNYLSFKEKGILLKSVISLLNRNPETNEITSLYNLSIILILIKGLDLRESLRSEEITKIQRDLEGLPSILDTDTLSYYLSTNINLSIYRRYDKSASTIIKQIAKETEILPNMRSIELALKSNLDAAFTCASLILIYNIITLESLIRLAILNNNLPFFKFILFLLSPKLPLTVQDTNEIINNIKSLITTDSTFWSVLNEWTVKINEQQSRISLQEKRQTESNKYIQTKKPRYFE